MCIVKSNKYAERWFSPIQTWQFCLVNVAVQNLAISVNLLALSSRLQCSSREDREEIVSWITLARADTDDDDEGLSIFPILIPWQGWTDLYQERLRLAGLSHKIIMFTISGRRRELERCRVADGLRRRDWKSNGCDKKYSSSSSSEKSYHHPNKSFLISYHQEERFSQLHLCLLYLVLVSLLHCAGEQRDQF